MIRDSKGREVKPKEGMVIQSAYSHRKYTIEKIEESKFYFKGGVILPTGLDYIEVKK